MFKINKDGSIKSCVFDGNGLIMCDPLIINKQNTTLDSSVKSTLVEENFSISFSDNKTVTISGSISNTTLFSRTKTLSGQASSNYPSKLIFFIIFSNYFLIFNSINFN